MGDLLGSPRVASLLFAPRDDGHGESVGNIFFPRALVAGFLGKFGELREGMVKWRAGTR